MEKGLSIVLPTRPQPDTIVAIFLLKTFGTERFKGIENALITVKAVYPQEPLEASLARGELPVDVGGGELDHHNTGLCVSEIVAKMFGVERDPSIGKLIAYAKRDDAEGKGTMSDDALDRAFGLSGLISSLNKRYPNDVQKVVEAVLPLLEAHYYASREHHVELPNDVLEKKKSGDYSETRARQGTKMLKIVFVVSDKPSMPTYLRSWKGAHADVVVLKAESSNHVCVITQQARQVNLSLAMALIRLREAELRGLRLSDDIAYLSQDGKLSELPLWYLDPATISILNPKSGDATAISWNEMKQIVVKGLEVAPERPDRMETHTA